MENLYAGIVAKPGHYRQLNCGEALLTIYNCPLENKYQDFWSQHNYVVYVIEGRKVWHTAHSSYDLQKDNCVFVRKGAFIVEQFFDPRFCLILFFLPDEFICEVLKTKATPINQHLERYEPVMNIDSSPAIHAYFQSVMPYFEAGQNPDQSLLHLKFRELILLLADNPANHELLSYFCSLLQAPQSLALQKIMEDNYCFNLKLEEFAQLSNRSLSAFKRDFQKIYKTTPGRWLLEKRLNHAMHLLTNLNKTVSETAFESGFENPSHFSRAFKQHYGKTPIAIKQS